MDQNCVCTEMTDEHANDDIQLKQSVTPPIEAEKEHAKMAGSTKVAMNLSNSIIGVSILAMPYCMKMCGVFLGFLMLIFSALLTRFTCHLLLKSAIVARRKSFEFLAFHTFGPVGKLIAELNIIGFMLGILISFFVVIGDLGPAIVSQALKIQNSQPLRTVTLVFVGFGAALPLAMLKELDSLARISTLSIVFYLILALKTIFESLPVLFSGSWIDEIVLWEPSGILQSLPIFSLALSCQTQIFEIYDSMPDPSLKQMNSLVKIVMYFCTILYFIVGVFGYIANYNKLFTGNILLSFSPGVTTEIIKLFFVFAVALSFPLVIFPCRTSIHSLLYRRTSMPFDVGGPVIPQSRFKIITFFIVCSTLVIGILCPNIEIVLGFTGSTIGICTCVVFPALMFIHLVLKNTFERWGAQFALIIGVLLMASCTWANMGPVTSAQELVYKKHEVPPLLPEIVKMPEEHQVKMSVANMPLTKESKLMVPEDIEPDRIPVKKEGVGCPKGLCNISEALDDNPKRQEPPIPQEPEETNEGNDRPEPKVVVKEAHEAEKIKVEENVKTVQNDLEMENKRPNSENKLEDDGKKTLHQQEEILRKLEEQQKQQKILLEEQREILKELKAHERSHDKNGQRKEKRTESVEATALEPHDKKILIEDKSKTVPLHKVDELASVGPIVRVAMQNKKFETADLNTKETNSASLKFSNSIIRTKLEDINRANEEIIENVGLFKDDVPNLSKNLVDPLRIIENDTTENMALEPEKHAKLSANQVKMAADKFSNSTSHIVAGNSALQEGSTIGNKVGYPHPPTIEILATQRGSRLIVPDPLPELKVDEKLSENVVVNEIPSLVADARNTHMEAASNKQLHDTVDNVNMRTVAPEMVQETFEGKKVGRDLKNNAEHIIDVNI